MPAHSTPTILVVEDERRVRLFVRRILGMAGYVILEACSGAEAARICASHKGAIDL